MSKMIDIIEEAADLVFTHNYGQRLTPAYLITSINLSINANKLAPNKYKNHSKEISQYLDENIGPGKKYVRLVSHITDIMPRTEYENNHSSTVRPYDLEGVKNLLRLWGLRNKIDSIPLGAYNSMIDVARINGGEKLVAFIKRISIVKDNNSMGIIYEE